MVLLDIYDRDLRQIQYGYSNENHQVSAKGLKKAVAKGMPVVITEPLLGGKLASSLSEATIELLKVMRFGTKLFVRKK